MLRFKQFAFSLALLIVFASLPAAAQQAPPPLAVKPLNGDVYWTQGGAGGNTGIIVGKDGVIVVDAKTTPASATDVLAEIAKITPKPVNTAILTHSDGDHVNGLAAFPKGITVIAQENCKKEMEASESSRAPAPADFMPTKTVDKKETVTIDGVKLELLHWAPAHTSGDLIVYLPKQKIVFTGDIITTNRPWPLIHLEKNGTSAGWIETVKGLVALNADVYVSGHGDTRTKAEVQKRLADVEERRAKIKELIGQGKSLEDIETAVGDTPPPATGNGPRFPTFTETTYKELTSKS
jgi:cyclase